MQRAIVISWTVPEARRAAARYQRNGLYEVVAYASPRSLDRLRGVTADTAIYCAGTAANRHLVERLDAAVAPCLATSTSALPGGE